MAKILIVDDEEKICFALSAFLKGRGHETIVAATAEDALAIVQSQRPHIVFLDIRLPGRDGLSVLKEIRGAGDDVQVVVMTAHGTMNTAITAIQQGAYDYLTKPMDLDVVAGLVDRMLRSREAERIDMAGDIDPAASADGSTIIGKSQAIQDIYKMIGLLTTNDVPVLIEGESGVGKELVARAIHFKSNRCDRPFVAINCGAMPESLLETELFGHEKGSFTGAAERKIGKFEFAGTGTIFLDEIGELQLPLQIKLLRVLQERQMVRVGGLDPITIHARVIAATNKNLTREVDAGRFRSDLYYRLQLITLKLPPLRQRREDIRELTDHFIKKANLELGKVITGIESDAMDRLMAHHWPGNIRELENVIKRAAILTRGDTISLHRLEITEYPEATLKNEASSLPVEQVVQMWFSARGNDGDFEAGRLHAEIMARVEKTLIREALAACDNNQVQASALLGMNRSTFRKKVAEYGL
ncbi:MAG: sigma-54-dependent Fis family transcriptional regulator [Desulfosarcina sp.]|nr:sigma-54-dependent Fis family transcriptional regulator [Desulfosarcina sp.]MBC2741614.1 sigma-54-dependent Fis family transcriptional regulator [Desulfosarcina sp.]MBC2764528.1 sigma-54-dependent Fis family transcriptional regulator [Desulfosarcina sp.]